MKEILLIAGLCLSQWRSMAQDMNVPDGVASEWSQADSMEMITDLVGIVKENSKVVLNWRLQAGSPAMPDYLVVERSTNGQNFEVVAVLKQAAMAQWKEWVDDAPAKGRNVYRIRYSGKEGVDRFSRPVSILVAGDISFRFYPNPVDNILIVRSETPADLQIVDASGKVRMAVSRLQRLQTLNLGGLEKGIYMIRVFNKTAGLLVQERLLKN